MICAFDSYYFEDKVRTAAILFENWSSVRVSGSFTEILDHPQAYQSGQFYKRELPGILRLWETIPKEQIDLILVDAFVYLDDQKKLGLGGYLYENLQQKYPVAGIAKTDYLQVHKFKKKVFRGQSAQPLFVSAAGVDLDWVADKVTHMYGLFRIPELLKELDHLSRGI